MLPTKLTGLLCSSSRQYVKLVKHWILLPTKAGSFTQLRHLAMAIRLFEGKEHAKLYAKYRPTYPDAMFEEIFKYCFTNVSYTVPLDLAVDVGCGSGQSTRPLCRYFRKVIGSDVSEQQIKSAISKTADEDIEIDGNVEYRTSAGEDLSFLEDSSVDLITIAQALHWLNHDVFYSEVKRVLKPNGVFAAYGYGINVLDDDEAEKLQQEFYWGLLGDYWDKERHHIENHFGNLKFPFEPVTRIETDNISIRRQMPVSAYVGYVSTWSAWQKHKEVNQGSKELQDLHKRLHNIYSKKSDLEDPTLEVFWPGFLILTKKPA